MRAETPRWKGSHAAAKDQGDDPDDKRADAGDTGVDARRLALSLAFASNSTEEAPVKRTPAILAALGLALVLAGCVGQTDPATNVSTISARL
jgi:hypothetical protein